MESCYATVDGVPVHYVRTGSGPPVVLVHGLIADHRNWVLNMPALSEHRTVYAIDMLNMGRSGRVAAAEASLAASADWLARLLDALAIDAADLVGSSHGGAVCLMLAVRNPERVRSLILFDPANPFCQQARLPIRFWTSPSGNAFARLLPHLPRFAADFAHRRAYGDPRKALPELLEGYLDGLNRTSIDHVLRITASWWADMAELERGLPALQQTPILLAWGDRDRIVSLASAARLQQATGASLQIFTGVGHLPFAEAPDEANQLMIGWLNR